MRCWKIHGNGLLCCALLVMLSVAAMGDTFESVETVLTQSPMLVRHHRGYLAFLRDHPALADTESSYWHYLGNHPEYARDAAAVESTLLRSPAARDAFDAFYGQLADNGNLLHALEAFQRAQQSLLKGLGATGNLDTNPLQWLSILGGEDDANANANVNAALGTLLERLAAEPALAGALTGNLRALTGGGMAITGWWTQLATVDAASGGAYGRLAAHFLADAEAFPVWHTRQLRLAAFPKERPWLRWWLVRVGETEEKQEGFMTDYAHYLASLLQAPEYAVTAEAHWRATFGPPLPWPPHNAPPGLRLQRDGKGITVRQSGHSTGNPAAVTMPAMPQRPTMPTRPTQPPKPEKPTP